MKEKLNYHSAKPTIAVIVVGTALLNLLGFFSLATPTYAADCPIASGSVTISSSCTFSADTIGVDSASGATDTGANTADLIIDGSGVTLTVNAGQTIAWGDELKVQNGASIAINDTGQLKQGKLWFVDADGDCFPDKDSATITTDTSSVTNGTRMSYYINSCLLTGTQKHQATITITNAGGQQTNYDAVITLNTATLISEGKMQSDCDDMRFYDDTLSQLTYWIESGCNTNTTQVWVRIPDLAASGDTVITMTYNDPAATSAQQSWSGTYIAPFNTTCPTDWTANTNLNTNNRFARGNSSSGGTGTGGHTHSYSSLTSGTPSTTMTDGTGAGSTKQVASQGHTHSISFSTDSTTYLPPYEDVVYCTYTGSGNLAASLPTSYLGFFTSNPSGWTRDAGYDGLFLRGNSTAGGTGGSSTHNHTYSGTSGTGGSSAMDSNSNTVPVAVSSGHTHSSSGSVVDATNVLPLYLNLIFSNPDSATSSIPSGTIAAFTAIPPMGWTSYTSLNSSNRFPRGASTSGGTGGGTHSHSVSGTLDEDGFTNKRSNQSTTTYARNTHTHTYSGTSDNVQVEPAYYDVVYAQRATDSTTKNIDYEGVGLNAFTYKKVITLNNTGGLQSNYHALLTVDTAALVTAGKMQSDCDDIRFRSSSGVPMPYWIESGCNTSTTSIWVEVPSLAANSDTNITMYYGNASATSGAPSWSQSTPKTILPFTSSCTTGWSEVTAAANKWLRGASTYGGTGGTASHTHSISGTSGAQSNLTGNRSINSGLVINLNGHTHSYSITSGSANNDPPNRTVVLCEYSGGTGIPTTLPTASLAFFTTLPAAGWTRDINFDTKLLKAAASAGTDGGGSHSHSFSGSLGTDAGTNLPGARTSALNATFSTSHSHGGISGTSSSDTDYPPYLDVLIAAPSSAFDMSTVSDPIIMASNFDTLPPLGWTQYSSLNNTFPRGNSSSGGTGGGSTAHTYSDTSTGPSATITAEAGASNFASSTHTHDISGSTDANTSVPPYFNVVFVQRKEDDTTKTYGAENAIGGLTADCDDSNANTATSCDKYVFISSSTYTGSQVGSLFNADSICRTDAAAANLKGQYKAFLSNSNVQVKNRITHSTSNYKLPSGTVIANGWSDLMDGSIDNAITEKADQGTSATNQVWTGASSTGGSHANNCSDWTSNSSGVSGAVGRRDILDTSWLFNNSNTCDLSRHIYCVQQ